MEMPMNNGQGMTGLLIYGIVTGNADGKDEQDCYQPGSHAQLDHSNLACSV